jgi:hypothetical protein
MATQVNQSTTTKGETIMTDYYSKEETRQALAEECAQLKAAITVGLRLNDDKFTLKAYIRLHEIEDGY